MFGAVLRRAACAARGNVARAALATAGGLGASQSYAYQASGGPKRVTESKQIFESKTPVLCVWLGQCSVVAAEALAGLGFDAAIVDAQHGANEGGVLKTLQTISAAPGTTAPIVRVSRNDAAEIGFALDAGARCVICPMINSRGEAEAFVAAARFPPLGCRSFGPIRGADMRDGLGAWTREANRTVATLAMIETRSALDNLEAILQTPGLTGIFIGPNDLSLALGNEPSSAPTGESLRVIEHVLARAHAHGLKAGIFCLDAETATAMVARGFDLVNVSHDGTCLTTTAAGQLAAVRTDHS